MARKQRDWGKIRELPSGRYQASYVGPDLVRRPAPNTFTARTDAEGWLNSVRRRIEQGTWTAKEPEETPTLTLREYAEGWFARRDVRGTTRRGYVSHLNNHILPALGDRPLAEVTPGDVAAWHADVRAKGKPTSTARAYGLLSTIFNTAVAEDLIPSNPCRVKGAGQAKRAKPIVVLEPDELDRLADAMPPEMRALVLVAGWGSLRMGELLELRRGDIDPNRDTDGNVTGGVISVTRQMQYEPGKPPVVGPPKTDAGVRDVHLPRRAMAPLVGHMDKHSGPGPTGLIFPSPYQEDHQYWNAETVREKFIKAAYSAGYPGLTVHGLRHTAAVLAARTGATTAELMARIGHSSPQAAMRYQHAVASRDARIAEALDRLHEE